MAGLALLSNFGPPRPSTYGSRDWIGGPFVDWNAKVDLFEQLRREHEFGIGTVAGVAAKSDVHRRVVRRALASALPPPHDSPERSKPKLGAVEGEVGYFRHNHLVPVPSVADLDALNVLLLSGCLTDEARVMDGRTQSVGTTLAEEHGHLLLRVAEGFDLADIVFPSVVKQGCVTVKTNFYSVPTRAGTRVEARVHPLHVEVWHAGRLIDRHERCHSRRQHVLGPSATMSSGTGYGRGTASRTTPVPWWR